MSDDFYGDGGDPEETVPEEGLLESVHKKPDDPLMEAALHFDLGLDEIVSGMKKMVTAMPQLKEQFPDQFTEVEKKLLQGLMPWVEAVDDDFSKLFPDVGEEKK